MRYLLGIDIGTTNVKAALFERNGNCAGAFGRPYPTDYPEPGKAEQHPNDWYLAVVEAVRGLLRNSGVNGNDIAAIGFSGHIRSVAFLDDNFKTLHPGIIWSDTRSSELVRDLPAEVASDIRTITGNQAAANFALPNMLWLKQRYPDLFDRTRYFATPKDYVIQRFTGEWVGDASGQAGSLLLDVRKRDWSDQLLERFGIPKASLPPVHDCTAVIGGLTSRAAGEIGLPQGLPVVVGGGDNDCAAIGAGAFALGTTSISLGTAGIILTQLETPPARAIGDLDVLPHVISDRWYAMGMVPSAGMSLAWLKRRLADETLEAHSDVGLTTDAWMTVMGPAPLQSPVESDDLFFFPYLQGKGNPSKNAAARGVFWGLSGGHGNAHLVRAVMEGTGYCVGQCVDQISRVAEIEEVVCCGGGSSSAHWMQILANILNRPVWTQQDTEVGALGAAILAATGVGMFDTVHSACSEMTRRDVRYEPVKRDVHIYASKADRFSALSERFWGAGSPACL